MAKDHSNRIERKPTAATSWATLSDRSAARDLLYTPSHRKHSTYQSLLSQLWNTGLMRTSSMRKHGATSHSEKEGNVLFNDTLNTFYLRLYGIRYFVEDHSIGER